MKKILIVDSDALSLKTFLQMQKSHIDTFEIHTAKYGKEAKDIVDSMEIDLLITDLDLPDIETFELIPYMDKNFPDIPLLLTTDTMTPEKLSKIKNFDISHYFEKPLDIEALTEKIFEELDVNVGGQIYGIGLSAFLQMMEMEEKTCTLKIKQRRQFGYLFLLKGELIAAETGDLKNEAAAYEILSWEKPVIEFENVIQKKERGINKPLMLILMETLKIKDEKVTAKGESSPSGEPSPSSAVLSDNKLRRIHSVGAHMGLGIGTQLHIKCEGVAIAIKAFLAGMEPDEYLIIKVPEQIDMIKDKLYKGKDYLIKYIYRGVICSFKSKLIDQICKPVDLLFLEYPKIVEHNYIRSQKRARCFIPAKINYKSIVSLGTMLDVNPRGCGCLLHGVKSDVITSANTNDSVSLLCQFPGIGSEIEISGTIKNIRIAIEGTIIGIEFDEKVPEGTQNIIINYILSVGDLQEG